jgi:hypothetical protein
MTKCHNCDIEFEGKMLRFEREDDRGFPYLICEACEEKEEDLNTIKKAAS